MSDSDNIRGRLELREGADVGECGSLDEAVLWCYRHDFHPISPWPYDRADPEFDIKIRFALPHLTDYLRLILRDPAGADIEVYARSLYSRIIEETQAIARYADGSLRQEGIAKYLSRFASAEYDRELRDHDVSIYPFARLEIDIEDLVSRPVSGLDDDRTQYLATQFSHYFPSVAALSQAIQYPSYDDRTYAWHTASIAGPMEWFAFSNPAVPSTDKFKWREGIERLSRWATVQLRPRIEGEDF